jgi:hypothetical protein
MTSPLSTIVLLIVLIVALGFDIAVRTSCLQFPARDLRQEVRLAPPLPAQGRSWSSAVKRMNNPPAAASPSVGTPQRTDKKKKICDRVEPSP